MAKLSAKAKAANLIAAKDAHIAQVQRLNDTLRAALAAAGEDKATLDRQLDIAGREARIGKESVALFKQEALQSAVREAELRGYIQRTLEDDAVREPAPAKSELTDDQRQHMIERLGRDDRARNRPAPRRTGPSAMHPQVIVRDGCDGVSEHWRPHAWDRAVTMRNDPPSRSDPLGQRHWMER